jgi:hypothetical protein
LCGSRWQGRYYKRKGRREKYIKKENRGFYLQYVLCERKTKDGEGHKIYTLFFVLFYFIFLGRAREILHWDWQL